jgi:hypothetical protein
MVAEGLNEAVKSPLVAAPFDDDSVVTAEVRANDCGTVSA